MSDPQPGRERSAPPDVALVESTFGSRAQLEAVLSQLPAGVIIAEAPSGRLILGNPQVERIWRHPFLAAARVADYSAYQGFHADGRPYRPEEWPLARAILHGETVEGEEIRFLRGDDTSGWMRVNAGPIRDTGGHIVAGVVVFHDVTSEVGARQHAAATTERLRHLIDVLAAMAAASGVDEVVRQLGERTVRAMGARRGALALITPDGESLHVVHEVGYAPDLVQRFRFVPLDAALPLAAAARTGTPVFAESLADLVQEYPELDGISTALGTGALAAVPLREEGRAIGALGLSFAEPRVFDAEERAVLLALGRQYGQAILRARLYEAERAARAAAEAAERRAAALAEASRAFSAAGPDMRDVLDTVAARLAEVLGDFCGIALVADDGEMLEFVALRDRDPAAEAFSRDLMARHPVRVGEGLSGRVVSTGQPFLQPVLDVAAFRAVLKPEHRAAAERYLPGSLLAVPLRIGSNPPLGVIGMSRRQHSPPFTTEDLTLLNDLADRAALAIERARLLEAARAAVHARDEFLSVAAHELRTPITSLRGFAQLLLRRLRMGVTLSMDDVRATLLRLESQADRLQRLVDQLLDVSRIQAGRLSLERHEVDVAKLLHDAVEAARLRAPGHTITVEAPATPLLAHVDALRLEQVLTNLLDNAAKYSPTSAPITACLQATDETLRFEVLDRGTGVPEEHRAHIFDRFYQGGGQHSRGVVGLGLGLYISREIVELHGGSIRAEFPAEGGSRFVVDLPRGGTA